MKIVNVLARRGNEWIPRYILDEESSEFVEFQPSQKNSSEIIAVFKRYLNAESKANDVGGRFVKVSYQRIDLKTLFVKFPYRNKEEFYQRALEEINKVIAERYNEGLQISLEDIDLGQCHYNEKLSTIAVKSTCPFWYDRCIITNEK